jgi:2-iminobutanoate/2-iminopropanoate deaminase
MSGHMEQRWGATTVQTDDAPAAVGPYSAGVVAPVGAALLFVSGQLPMDPASGETVQGDLGVQVTRALRNGLAVVEAAGSRLADIVKTTVFVTDLGQFGVVNDAYAAFFGDVRPARAVVEVSRLPRDSAVEVEMIAAVRP